jgi:glycosyltransferase involved in cell wall biosynthesis
VIAAFDAASHVGEAVESVLAQTFEDFELVAVDDASSDGTPEILDRYRDDPRLVVLTHGTNRGLAAALTTGCERARGRYIARLDADDVAQPDRLERQVAYLDENPDVAILGSAAIFTDADGREFARFRYPATHEAIRERLETGSAFVHSTVTMRRADFERVGGYRLAPRCEDYDLWLRIVERFRAANLPDFLVRYRVHGEQLTARRLREEAVCSLVADVAAQRRAAGQPDPLDDIAFVDDAVAESLGVDGRMVAREHVRRSVWYARLLAAAGYASEARTLLERALEIAAPLDDRERADVRRAMKKLRRTPRAALEFAITRWLRRFAR